MNCVHRINWSVKRPEDCRFRLSVSHYKDRIISPNPYEGDTVITPSDERQTLPTRGKYLSNNVVINPIPSNYGKISWNGSVLTIS